MVQSQRHSFGAFALIGLGVLFLVGQVFNINVWEIIGFSWPVFVMIPGVIFLGLALVGDSKAAGFAVPGAVITGTGAILWFQNATDNWQSWAYIWALYPVFVGLALMFMGRRQANDKQYTTGRGLVTWGFIAFLSFAAFFELLIFGGSGALTRYLLPAILIGAGGFMLLRGRIAGSEKRKVSDVEFSFSGNGKHKPERQPMTQSERLRQQIDDALAEDEPDDLKPTA